MPFDPKRTPVMLSRVTLPGRIEIGADEALECRQAD
jgi:hypothetical protein